MTRVLVALVACSFVFAGWRNLPRIDDPSSAAAGVFFAVVFVAVYLLGRRSVSAEAVATATANARATAAAAAHAGAQAVSQVVVNVSDGARATAARELGQPSWIGAPVDDGEQIEGSDAVLSIRDEMFDRALETDTDRQEITDRG